MGKRKALLGRVSDVDLRLLRIFQTVVNCGGFSAAEIDLGIGRSTISTHIGELEGRLGTRLCSRGRGGFALTARGKKIYEASLGLMKSLDDFRNEVNADQDAVTGEINIGMVDNIIWDKELRLRNVFRDFSKVAANIDLTLYVLSPDEIERRVLDERLHVGIAPVMHEIAGLSYGEQQPAAGEFCDGEARRGLSCRGFCAVDLVGLLHRIFAGALRVGVGGEWGYAAVVAEAI
jgi:DNA-binding transcriptional LysR family regulator